MGTRRIGLLAAAIACGMAWCATGSAELNLWRSHHYAGEINRGSGEYADAETLLAEARQEHCRDRDEAHRLASTLDRMGVTQMALDNYERSEKCLKCSLALKEKELGPNSRHVPTTLNSLGDLYYITGQPDKAEAMYRRALKLNERDQMNIEVCRGLNGLALIRNGEGSYVEAEELLKRAISIHERHLRRWHPYCATVYTNLGILYTNLGRFDEAEPRLEHAEYVQDKSLGTLHPDVALRLSAQAALYAKTDRHRKAARMEGKAEAIRAHFAELNQ